MILGVLALVLVAGSAGAEQYPILDKIANKVIAKYQSATCEQLWAEKMQGQQGKQHSPEEQRAIEVLKGDPQMQQAFFGKIATPVVTKMFQCGMIP
jgi:hypothetical protein